MGAAKQNPITVTTQGRGRFPTEFVRECAQSYGLHFAVALSRLSHWPIHAFVEGSGENTRQVFRFWCEADADWIFDFKGIFRPLQFEEKIIIPELQERFPNRRTEIEGGTKLWSEADVQNHLHLAGVTWDDLAIAKAAAVIQANRAYLHAIPKRPEPVMPADEIARYAFSRCSYYADALSRATGLPIMTIRPTKLLPGVEMGGSRFHTFVLHPDGQAEDVWGKLSIERIARRYGMVKWILDPNFHRAEMLQAAREVPDLYAESLSLAEAFIAEHHPAGKRTPG